MKKILKKPKCCFPERLDFQDFKDTTLDDMYGFTYSLFMSRCQFQDDANTQLTKIGSKYFCQYHLPWDREQIENDYDFEKKLPSNEIAKLKYNWTKTQEAVFRKQLAIRTKSIPETSEEKIKYTSRFDLSGLISSNIRFTGEYNDNIILVGSRVNHVHIHDAMFSKNFYFSFSAFDVMEIESSSFENITSFKKCNLNHFRLRKVAFISKLDFQVNKINKSPNFLSTTLTEETHFPNINAFKTKNSLARATYENLRYKMQELKKYDDAAMFWVLEQKCKREGFWRNKEFLNWVISWLYEKISNYSNSISKPIISFIAVKITFSFIYSLIEKGTILFSSFQTFVTTYTANLVFTTQQVTAPFYIWRNSNYADEKVLKFTTLVDTLLSLTIVTLFIMSIRRHFRMKD